MPTYITVQNIQDVPAGPWTPIWVGCDFVVTDTALKPEDINDHIQRALFAISPAIEEIIAGSCAEEYHAGGLKTNEGKLILFGCHLFDLSVRAVGYIVKVRAEWREPPIPYARIHLYGGEIKPRTKEYLRWYSHGQWHRSKLVIMPKRNYIRLDYRAVAKIENIIRTVLGADDKPGKTPGPGPIWQRIASIYQNLLAANSYHAQRRMARQSMPQVLDLLQQIGVSAFNNIGEWNIRFARDVILAATNKHKSFVDKIYGEIDRAQLSQGALRDALNHAQEPYTGNPTA